MSHPAVGEAMLGDLQRDAFDYFLYETNPANGLVRDKTEEGAPASIAAVGFALAAYPVGVERGFITRAAAAERTLTTLRFFWTSPQGPAPDATGYRGFYYHFLDMETGRRVWNCELSTIDTTFLLAGALAAAAYFDADSEAEREIRALADALYRRTDWQWAQDGGATVTHGWKPESGFLTGRWDHYCELMVLYLLAIGSPTHAIPSESWHAWRRPVTTFAGQSYIGGPDPLFVHQYSHAWVDFRGWREREPPHTDWWQNSVTATRVHKAFCLRLAREFPGYSENVWGITASDSRKGYVAWGGPPRHQAIDGSVVPCAAAGSLMLAPEITVPAIREMRRRFGDRIYGRYGFADAFHPTDGWVNPDVIGIDLGITLLSAENLRTGRVWRWFMRNAEIPSAMARAGLTRGSVQGASIVNP
jgi:hypothetical protein